MNIFIKWLILAALIIAAIAKRPIPGGALLTGFMCIAAAVIGYPMDLALFIYGSFLCTAIS